MLEQLFDLVRGAGQKTVVENPEVPNEYNNDVMAEATNTVAGGLKNVMAGGGLESIINLFQRGGQQNAGGAGGLLKNPMVTMMIGHLISKLTGKYNMSPASASNVATNLVPNVLDNLIQKTQDPNNSSFTLDKLIGSLTGGGNDDNIPQQGGGGFNFQDLISNFTGSGNNGGNSGNGGFDLQDIISKVTDRARNNIGNQSQSGGGGGLFDLIKGFIK
jgi:hypothetical protein